MSFIRMPPRNRGIGNPASHGSGQKRRVRRKPKWDDTVQDLTVHKASPDELERRKQSVKSKNLDLVKAEKFGKKIAKVQHKTPGSARKRRQNALLREILFDQSQLQETLNKSDKVMAVVKDIFGDDAQRKYRALPNVTVAPALQNTRTKLPDGSLSSGPSKLDKLSDSQMDKSALNDVDDGSWASSEESEHEESDGYQPVMDLGRFQRLLVEAEQERAEATRTAGQHLSHSMAERALEEVINELEFKHRKNASARLQLPETSMTQDGSFLDDTLVSETKVNAINDTGKIKRTMARTDQSQAPPQPQLPSQPPNLDDLRRVLQGLEKGVAEVERESGRQPPPDLVAPPDNETFSGITQSLISAVARLTLHLRESEHKLKVEATLRDQLAQDVSQFKALVDALTSDIISTQEEYGRLQNEFVKYKRESENQFTVIRQTLANAGIQVPVVRPHPLYPSQMNPMTNGGVQMLPAQQPSVNGDFARNIPASNGNKNGSDDAQSIVSMATVEELALNMDRALKAQLSSQVPTEQTGRGYGLPRPNLPGEIPSSSTQRAAFLLSPPRQADSPKVQGRMIPSTGLDEARNQMRYDPPQRVQNIVREQQMMAAKQQALQAANQRLKAAPPVGDSTLQPIQSAEVPQYRQSIPEHQPQSGDMNRASQPQPSLCATTDRDLLQQQLAELNRQHLEAQRKIELLQQSHATKMHGPVSPSISPIPQAVDTASEVSSHLQPVRRQVPQQGENAPQLHIIQNKAPVGGQAGAFAPVRGGLPREIRVSVPQMIPVEQSPN